MPISLKKGQKVSLSKENPGLTKVLVGLGWDVNAFDSGYNFDLDASAFMVGSNGKCPTEKEFIFYSNLEHPSESVKHMGDNLTGAGEGDDEQIVIELDKVPAQYDRIVVVVNIFRAEARHQHFGMIENAFIRIVDARNNQELCRFNLSEHYDGMTAMIFGEVYRHGNEWKFNAIGSGYQGGLAALCANYGVEVED